MLVAARGGRARGRWDVVVAGAPDPGSGDRGASSGLVVGGRSGERGWREPTGGVVGARERNGRGRAGGEPQNDLAGVVDDAGGDTEQRPAHELRLAAAREMPGRLGSEH